MISVAQESLLLDFYGLDTLMPETWTQSNQQPQSPLSNGSPPVTQNAALILEPLTNTAEDPEPTSTTKQDQSDPLGIRDSVLSRQQRAMKRLTVQEKRLRSQLFISSRDFDPRRFLAECHRQTAYRDLCRGWKHLQKTVEQQEETLKSLVKGNFDRFVGAKSTVDRVYRELKLQNLNSAGFGTEELRLALEDANKYSEAIFRPIVDRRRKAEKLRGTLNMLERFKFFFNLPTALQESMATHKYDQTVRDYKKGRSILAAATAQQQQQVQQGTTMGEHTHLEPLQSPQSAKLAASGALVANTGMVQVFEKVWEEVERVVQRIHMKLLDRLADMSLPMDVQERNISYLIELNAAEDPVWYFLSCRHKWIIQLLRNVQDQYQRSMEELAQKFLLDADDPAGDPTLMGSVPLPVGGISTLSLNENAAALATLKWKKTRRQFESLKFRKSVMAAVAHDYESIFGRDLETMGWLALIQLVTEMSKILTAHLSDFWKLCRHYFEGKYHQKVERANNTRNAPRRAMYDSKKAETCQKMFNQILDVYNGHLQSAFAFASGSFGVDTSAGVKISPVKATATLTKSTHSTAPTKPQQESTNAISGTDQKITKPLPKPEQAFMQHLRRKTVPAFYYLPTVVVKIAECCQDLERSTKQVSGSRDHSLVTIAPLFQTLDKLRKSFLDMLCSNWIRESAVFYVHENWKIDQETKNTTTLLRLYHRFNKLVLRSLFQIAAMIDLSSLKMSAEESRTLMIPNFAIDKIRSSLLACEYGLLDGLYFLAFHPTGWEEWTNVEMAKRKKENQGVLSIPDLDPNQYRSIDVYDKEIRLLVLLGNVDHLQAILFPKIFTMFADLFKITSTQDTVKLTQSVVHLDYLVFEEYIKSKTSKLSEIIEQGILYSGYDWKRKTKPESVQPYVNEALLFLVLVHAEIVSILQAASDFGFQILPSPSSPMTENERLVSSPLSSRIFGSLLHNILQIFLSSFRQVDGFSGEGGSIQLMIDIHAVSETLHKYLEALPDLKGIVQLILGIVHAENGSQYDDHIDRVVSAWRRGCEVEFTCLEAQI